CQLPVAEGDEEVEFGEVAAGGLGVAGGELVAGGEAGRQVGGHAEGGAGVAAFGPVGHQGADGGERVAERAELPVDHRGDLTVVGQDHVVEAVVAVDDRGAHLGG